MSLQRRLLARMESMVDRLSRGSARIRAKVLTKRVDVLEETPDDKILHENKKSSWVKNFTYDNRTGTLYMTVYGNSKVYEWLNVPPELAFKILRGDASCKTSDWTGQNRWWVGKNPSLGAAYWTYLKNYAVRQGRPAQSAAGYMDIMDMPADPRYMKKVGRPRKIERNTRDFKWTPQFQRKHGKVGSP